MVCYGEISSQLLADTRPPLPTKPVRPRRENYEYRRAGTRNLFLACEPKADWRQGATTQRCTMREFAHQMRWLVDDAYPPVPVVRLVLDNLDTHRTGSLYEAFPAGGAGRIPKRMQFHPTPKGVRWLNMAEIEFSVLTRAWRRGRNAEEDPLEEAVTSCVSEQNATGAAINWRFSPQDTSTKLRRLIPCQS